MSEYPRPLTLDFVKRRDLRPGKYFDRDGLYLRVRRSGRKYWEHRFRVNGELRTKGLGPFPVVTLAAARHMARLNLVAVHEGNDPFPQTLAASVPTVAELYPVVIDERSSGWKRPREAKRWRGAFENHVCPKLGDRLVCDLERRDLLEVLAPIWSSKPTVAAKVRGCLSALFDHALDAGYLGANLVDDVLLEALPKVQSSKSHFAAVPPAKVADVIAFVECSGAMAATKLSLRFQILTAARLGEVRDARWRDVDVAKRVWTVSAEAMKAGEEHQVPLSSQSLAILDGARLLGGANDLVFPSRTGAKLSNTTHSKIIRAVGFTCVPHGFRSSFRDWCAMNAVPREVAEACLAHRVGNEVEGAYARSSLLERRRSVMQKWADYLDEQTPAVSEINAQVLGEP